MCLYLSLLLSAALKKKTNIKQEQEQVTLKKRFKLAQRSDTNPKRKLRSDDGSARRLESFDIVDESSSSMSMLMIEESVSDTSTASALIPIALRTSSSTTTMEINVGSFRVSLEIQTSQFSEMYSRRGQAGHPNQWIFSPF